MLKLKLLNIRLNGMFIGVFFFNFESLLHVLKYREKYFFRYVFHKNGHRIDKNIQY